MVIKIFNMLKRGDLRIDHPLQRKPNQFDIKTRDGLIATIIKDEDMDSIKICEQLGENGVTLWLIDGLQRLTTIQMYRNGVFKLGRSIEFPIIKYQLAKKDKSGRLIKNKDGELEYDIVEYDLRGKGYADLSEELKEMIDNYKINIVKHLDCTDEEVGYHIRRYNRQVPMNTSQNSITYMDNTAGYVKDITINSRFFKDCGYYTENERRKNILDKIVIESIMTMFHLDHWQKNANKLGSYVNSNARKEEFEIFKNNLHRLERIITAPNKLFNSKNSFIWFALFYRFTKLGMDDVKFKNFLDEFLNSLHSRQIDGTSFDELNQNRATKDKSVVMKKLDILEKLMLEYLHINREEIYSEFTVRNEELKKYIHEFNRTDFGKFLNIRNDNDKIRVAVQSLMMICGEKDLSDRAVLAFINTWHGEKEMMEDTLFYTCVLNDWSLNIDHSSDFFHRQNTAVLIGVVSYAYKKEYDDDICIEWLDKFIQLGKTSGADLLENYQIMTTDLDNYSIHFRIS